MVKVISVNGKIPVVEGKPIKAPAYRTAAEQDIIDSGKQDKLIAGDNITISEDGKTISATGGGGELKWIKVASVTAEEETTVLSIGTDADGREISGYNAVAMIASLSIPKDSTQASANGSVWAYPAKYQLPYNFRSILNIPGWKTTDRGLNVFWCGLQDALYNSYSAVNEVTSQTAHIDILSGLYIYVQGQGDHLPVGTKVNIAVLSKGWNA